MFMNSITLPTHFRVKFPNRRALRTITCTSLPPSICAFKTNCLILTAVKNVLIFLGHPPKTCSVANILSFDFLVRKSVYDILWIFWKKDLYWTMQLPSPTFHATIWWTSTYISDCLAEKSTQIKRTAFLSTAASFYADRATYISSNECELPYLFD